MLFSIVTVCYNSEKTLKRTIDSILTQSLQDFEYIIVDGNSKDKTVQIIKDAEPLFGGRLKWLSEPDKGIYNAMNKGISMASGDIIGIVNSDDWYNPDTLQIIADASRNINLANSIFTGHMLFHYKKGDSGLYTVNKDTLADALSDLRMEINHPATFVPKQVYERLGTFDEEYIIAADADFIFRCHFNNINLVIINKALTNMAEGGVTSSNNKATLHDATLLYRKFTSSKLEYYRRMARKYIKYLIKGMTPRFLINYRRKVKVSE